MVAALVPEAAATRTIPPAEGPRLTGQVQPTAALIEVRQDLIELGPQSTSGNAA
jgi:hypothetical protein